MSLETLETPLYEHKPYQQLEEMQVYRTKLGTLSKKHPK